MALFLISTLVFALSVAAMAVGVLRGRAPLGGGCGTGIECVGCTRTCRRDVQK